jgi:putative transferase (TIGR04331 family)
MKIMSLLLLTNKDSFSNIMSKRVLITTADERSWVNNEPVLFLGEWCKRLSHKNRWQQLNSVTASYHWDDRNQLFQDYQYLQVVYEKVLVTLAQTLNHLHGVNRTVRYWRIILGPWLGYIVQILYDRYQMIKIAISNYGVSNTIIFDLDPKDMIIQDMSEFASFFISDIWNHWLYGEIIKEEKSINITTQKITSHSHSKKEKKGSNSGIKVIIKTFLRTCFNKFSSSLTKIDYFFIHSTISKQWRLEISLGQGPTFWKSPRIQHFEVDLHKRDEINLEMQVDNEFESLLLKIIPQQIPASYLEGYSALVKSTEKISWPKKPKVIFTASAHNSNDFFKIWAADKVESGTKLVINQHGGNFGVGKWNFHEDHEMLIADRYFSWGWGSKKYDVVKPMPSRLLSSKANSLTPNPKGKMLLVLASAPRYSYWMYSLPIASQFIRYIDDQIKFVQSLSEEIQKQLKVRFYMHDYGWDQLLRYKSILDKVETDLPSSKQSITKSINESRLYVATYNATTFLETLAANFPTIIFWNPEFWEIREDAMADFDRLREVGILHDSPESAARKVESIWCEVENWWSQPELQEVVSNFCEKYAKTSTGWLADWKTELTALTYE